ncbi:MAG: PAS domain S-box protein [Promethearchaeota archaeon]
MMQIKEYKDSKQAIMNLNIPFLELDSDLRIIEANKAFYKTFGYSKNEIEGLLKLQDILNHDIKSSKIDSMDIQSLQDMNVKFRKNDDSILYGKLNIISRNCKNDIVRYWLIINDTTPNNQLENELRHRLELERVIFSTATRLAYTNDINLHENIVTALSDLSKLFGSMRSYLLLFNKENNTIMDFFEWTGKNQRSLVENFKEIKEKYSIDLESILRMREFLKITDLTGSKEINERFMNIIKSMNFKELLSIPIFINYAIEAFLIFMDPDKIETWSENDFSTIQTISQIIGTVIDRLLIEQKLRNSERKYRSVLENIQDAYYEVDLNGNIVFFNYALCGITGYLKNELIGMNYREFVIEDSEAQNLYTVFNEVYRTKANKKNIEFELLKKDGKRIFVEASIYLKYDDDRNIIGFCGFLRDITERKKSERLKERYARQLEQEVQYRTRELQEALDQQKKYLDQIIKASQFKSEFMATMSHELRTPLNAIIGFSELLLEGLYGDLNKDQFGFINDIHDSAEHLLEMINRILDISKIEAGKVQLNIQPIIFNDILKHVEATIKPLYTKKNLEFKKVGLDEPKLIEADPIRLKEILLNLLSNAIKYTEEGSITLTLKEKETYIEISVSDTGIGIDSKDYDKVFKEFERIESHMAQKVEGTGLGLPLTKRLVELHGGEIFFSSELGHGTTFTFTIPKRTVDFGNPRVNPSISKKKNISRSMVLQILLIEDLKKDAIIIKKLLSEIKDFQCNIIWYKTLKEGIEYIKKNYVDVILLDLSLPDSNGINTLKKLMEKNREVPIVVLTVLNDQELAKEIVNKGAQDYLVKDEIDSNLMARSIRYAIERQKHIQELKKAKS